MVGLEHEYSMYDADVDRDEARDLIAPLKKLHALLVEDRTSSMLSSLKAQFHRLSFVSSGGFGFVVKGRNRIDKKYHAIKILAVRHNGDERRIREMLREPRLHGMIKTHDNIIRLVSSWTDSYELAPYDPSAAISAIESEAAKSDSGFSDNAKDEVEDETEAEEDAEYEEHEED